MKRLALLPLLLVSACGGVSHYRDPTENYSAPALNSSIDSIIAHEAAQATKARIMLAQIERTKAPPTVTNPEDGAPPELMLKITELNWSGPADNLLNALADKIGYRYVKSDVALYDPIMVNCNIQNETVAKALDDISLQVQDREQIIVDPDTKTISVRLNGSKQSDLAPSSKPNSRRHVLRVPRGHTYAPPSQGRS